MLIVCVLGGLKTFLTPPKLLVCVLGGLKTETGIHSFLDPPFSIFEWPTTHVQFFFQNDQLLNIYQEI